MKNIRKEKLEEKRNKYKVVQKRMSVYLPEYSINYSQVDTSATHLIGIYYLGNRNIILNEIFSLEKRIL